MKKSKLLVCISHHDSSLAAAKFACFKAKKSNFLVEILTVIDTTGKDYGLFSVDKVVRQEKIAESEQYIKEIVAKVQSWSDIIPIVNIREGFISDEIEKVVKNDDSISLIIIGASPNSSSKGKLASYLAEQIHSKIFTPIIIIPDNLTDEQLENIA